MKKFYIILFLSLGFAFAHSQTWVQRGLELQRLFGSVARGEQHEGSDVDLFVTMPPKMFKYIAAAQLIRDHQNLRPFFRQQIERDGIDVFTAA